MSVTLEQIEMLRERANVSYAEAKEVLERSNGDLLEALIMLEAESKVRARKEECCGSGVWKTSKGVFGGVKSIIKKGNETKFLIKNQESTVIDMPVTILVIITAIAPPLTVAGVLAAMVTKHKISFVKPDGSGMKINDTFNKVSSCVNSVSSQVVDAVKKD